MARSREDDHPRPLVEPSWEKQPGEPPKAYAGFRFFRDGSERTAISVARILDVPPTQITHWRTRFSWDERVLAYDNWKDGISLEARAAARVEAEEDLESYRRAVLAREQRIADGVFRKIEEITQLPVVLHTVDRQGNPVDVQNDALVRALAQLMLSASKLARLGGEMPTEGARYATPDTKGPDVSDLDAFFDSLSTDAEASALRMQKQLPPGEIPEDASSPS